MTYREKITEYIDTILDADTREYTRMLAILFVTSFVIGLVVMYAVMSQADAQTWMGQLQEEFGFIANLNWWQLFLLIFLNNTLKALIVMLGGILFGILPVVFILLNGYVIGMILAGVMQQKGIALVILGTIPHGIIEIPVVLIAAGYGVFLGERALRWLKARTPFRLVFRSVMRRFFTYLVPFLFIAALLEVTLSAFLIDIAM